MPVNQSHKFRQNANHVEILAHTIHVTSIKAARYAKFLRSVLLREQVFALSLENASDLRSLKSHVCSHAFIRELIATWLHGRKLQKSTSLFVYSSVRI